MGRGKRSFQSLKWELDSWYVSTGPSTACCIFATPHCNFPRVHTPPPPECSLVMAPIQASHVHILGGAGGTNESAQRQASASQEYVLYSGVQCSTALHCTACAIYLLYSCVPR